MRNQVEVAETAVFELMRLEDASPEIVPAVADQIDEFLRWNDPYDDPNQTANRAPIYRSKFKSKLSRDVRCIRVDPLVAHFVIDCQERPFIVTIIHYEWPLTPFDEQGT